MNETGERSKGIKGTFCTGFAGAALGFGAVRTVFGFGEIGPDGAGIGRGAEVGTGAGAASQPSAGGLCGVCLGVASPQSSFAGDACACGAGRGGRRTRGEGDGALRGGGLGVGFGVLCAGGDDGRGADEAETKRLPICNEGIVNEDIPGALRRFAFQSGVVGFERPSSRSTAGAAEFLRGALSFDLSSAIGSNGPPGELTDLGTGSPDDGGPRLGMGGAESRRGGFRGGRSAGGGPPRGGPPPLGGPWRGGGVEGEPLVGGPPGGRRGGGVDVLRGGSEPPKCSPGGGLIGG